jgi:hypothetical protein
MVAVRPHADLLGAVTIEGRNAIKACMNPERENEDVEQRADT